MATPVARFAGDCQATTAAPSSNANAGA